MSAETYAEIHDGAWGNFKGWATIDSARVGGYDWEEFRVMRGPDGLLYVGFSYGCRCEVCTTTHRRIYADYYRRATQAAS